MREWHPEAIRAALAKLPSAAPFGDEGARTVRWPAAVLVLLAPQPQGVGVLLTRRTPHLYHHPGQISFPGGRVEAGEESAAAALREAAEEVGLPPDRVQLLGRLPDYVTITGYRVTPWVGWGSEFEPLSPDPFEVAELFWLPVMLFGDPTRYLRLSLEDRGVRRFYWALPWRHYFIWGATAAMLRQLAVQLTCYRAGGSSG
jgi:8-oxo-dGTP pyrophosphatase MutT (NUDIX family)